MAEDGKDRLGDTLRKKEKAQEDEYFARRDRMLIEQRRAAAEPVPDANGRCAVCGARYSPPTSAARCPACVGASETQRPGGLRRWLEWLLGLRKRARQQP
jgi:hypothetical protein